VNDRAKPEPEALAPNEIVTNEHIIDEHCVVEVWTVCDLEILAKLIAIIAMGQARHAARILAGLYPAAPELKCDSLRADAKQRLTVTGDTSEKQGTRRWHRDGMIFEAISWIVARQGAATNVLMRDPHISATTQGLDGLMIELDETGETIVRATILEDKCSNDPRGKFRDEVLPAFQRYHALERASELVAETASLLDGRIPEEKVTEAAGRVLDIALRAYRAALTVDSSCSSKEKRKALFKGYEKLQGIAREQRIGATFLPPSELRDWFEQIARRAVKYIDELEEVDQ
jgi:hypothetical protein